MLEGVKAMDKVLSKIRPTTETCLLASIVAFYSSEHWGQPLYSGVVGLLRLELDRKRKTRFLTVYHLDTLSMAFSIEVYYQFEKGSRIVNDRLLLVDYVCGCVGFHFASKEEAEGMRNKILGCVPPIAQLQQYQKERLAQRKKEEEKTSFFGRLFGSKDKEEKQSFTVLSCKKVERPPEIKKIYEQLQESKKGYSDQQIDNLLMNEIVLTQVRDYVKDSKDPKLNKMMQEAEIEEQAEESAYIEQMRMTKCVLPPPEKKIDSSVHNKRGLLLAEIQKKNFNLKHVEVNSGKMNIDLEGMKPAAKEDFAQNMLQKMKRRHMALHPPDSDA